MGTNYYWIRETCPHCHRYDEEDRLHIGKSSAGWCFSLHVYPDDGIADLADWEAKWTIAGSRIEDEYHRPMTVAEMHRVITERAWPEQRERIPHGYVDWSNFHRLNGSVDGPNGLVRHALSGRFCIAHGAGTWDCMVGEFS